MTKVSLRSIVDAILEETYFHVTAETIIYCPGARLLMWLKLTTTLKPREAGKECQEKDGKCEIICDINKVSIYHCDRVNAF